MVAGVVAGLVAGVMRIKRRNFIGVLSLSVPISYLPKYDIGTRKDKTPQKFPSLIRTTPATISRINHAHCNYTRCNYVRNYACNYTR
jgi:hypothetical protein